MKGLVTVEEVEQGEGQLVEQGEGQVVRQGEGEGQLIEVELMKAVDVTQLISEKVKLYDVEGDVGSFTVCDLGQIVNKYQLITSLLNRVRPYYMVGCNEDQAVLSLVSHLGAGFSCTNKAEMQRLLSLNLSATDLSYVNPCKQTSHLKYAAKRRVPLVAFDSESELRKIKKNYPHAQLMLQVCVQVGGACDENEADWSKSCQVGGVSDENGFDWTRGCPVKECRRLFRSAQSLGLNVVGISGQLEGAADTMKVCPEMIVQRLREVFDVAQQQGVGLSVVDLGDLAHTLTDDADVINVCLEVGNAVEEFFPREQFSDVSLSAQWGQFLISSAFSLATTVVGKRPRVRPPGGEIIQPGEVVYEYYLSDGVYNTFTGLLTHKTTLRPTLVKSGQHEGPCYETTLLGPTCDSLDCVNAHCFLPQLDVSDWLVFHSVGGVCARRDQSQLCRYVIGEADWSTLCCAETSLLHCLHITALD